MAYRPHLNPLPKKRGDGVFVFSVQHLSYLGLEFAGLCPDVADPLARF